MQQRLIQELGVQPLLVAISEFEVTISEVVVEFEAIDHFKDV